MRGSSNNSRNSSILKNSSRLLDRSLIAVIFLLQRVKSQYPYKIRLLQQKNVKLDLPLILIMAMSLLERNINLLYRHSGVVRKKVKENKNILMNFFLLSKLQSFQLLFIGRDILVELRIKLFG